MIFIAIGDMYDRPSPAFPTAGGSLLVPDATWTLSTTVPAFGGINSARHRSIASVNLFIIPIRIHSGLSHFEQ